MSTDQPTNALLLPVPSPESLKDPSPNVPVGATVSLDNLGPMIVNNDGTLSRVANWENMTEEERERTLRVLAVRNRARLAKLQKDNSDLSS